MNVIQVMSCLTSFRYKNYAVKHGHLYYLKNNFKLYFKLSYNLRKKKKINFAFYIF